MAAYLFTFLNGTTERVGADRVDYDLDDRVFRAVCETDGIVFIAPAANVLSVRKDPPLSGEGAISLQFDGTDFRGVIERAVRTHASGISRPVGI